MFIDSLDETAVEQQQRSTGLEDAPVDSNGLARLSPAFARFGAALPRHLSVSNPRRTEITGEIGQSAERELQR